jgi:hypothetical protein
MDTPLRTDQSARGEAESLYRMAQQKGNSLESVRELIAVPKETEAILREYARSDPAEAYWVEGALRFRKAVAAEFERLCRAGAATMVEHKESLEIPDTCGDRMPPAVMTRDSEVSGIPVGAPAPMGPYAPIGP